jgi:hypothetical protein
LIFLKKQLVLTNCSETFFKTQRFSKRIFFQLHKLSRDIFFVLQMIEEVLVLQIMPKDFSRLRILKIKFLWMTNYADSFLRLKTKVLKNKFLWMKNYAERFSKPSFFSKHISWVFRALFFYEWQINKIMQRGFKASK